MSGLTKLSWNSKTGSNHFDHYLECVGDLIRNDQLYTMADYLQHGNTTCLEHSFYVSFLSYRLCKAWGFDYRSAARGGLLHDFFLYDWHKQKPDSGLHGLVHPRIALKNAKKYFRLNPAEEDIILKHMWPLTIVPPACKEALLVSVIDKYCTGMEVIGSVSMIARMMSEIHSRTIFDPGIPETVYLI
ncbi:HD domain-containing protein [Dehalobacter sp. DCM]|uniref:HD domain-containing protein n=1 Tax=Dehalobacter sp. DCM TaxID=2907827 RepID=UPI00308200C7|nr:HD domain-containing protein [Dehalobacter sp. DCM]